MPRMRAVADDSLVVEVTSRPGARIARSLMSLTPVSWSSWWLTVVTTIGTFWRFSGRLRAVTIMSATLSGTAWAAGCAGAAAAGALCARAGIAWSAMAMARAETGTDAARRGLPRNFMHLSMFPARFRGMAGKADLIPQG